ncbi:efflux RND transporter permease subunit [bacterium]|nr:efflux RND transporter permease subunit [bacterium]
MDITEFSLKRPITMLMIFVCFLVIGIISSRILPLEFFPDISFPYIDIDLPYPGSTPEETERLITRPAEEVLATISNIKNMYSRSGENGGHVSLEFEWGVDLDLKGLEAKEKLDGVRHLFPRDMERFYIGKASASDWELMALRISSNRDLSNAYDMLNRNLKRRLERIEGVSRINMYGIEKKEIRIQLDANKIIAHHVDLNRLSALLQRSNFQVTAGKITDGSKRFVVRPIGQFADVQDVADLIVADPDIRLHDIADVSFEHPIRDYGRHLDGKYAIGLDVFKESGANTVEVADRVTAEIEAIGKLPEMEGISLFYMDNAAEGIVSSLNELLNSGLLGGLFAILILFFFLRRLSTTLIVALAVPFSIFVTLAFMYFLGISLNILSMMGLMLAVGMLVDNAVVVTENMHRYQLKHDEQHHAILFGAQEVRLAVTAGTLTTCIVFLPNIISPNDEMSLYLKHVGITICIALGASLFIAQTVVPLLASKTRPPDRSRKTVINKLMEKYRAVLHWTLKHRKWSILAFVVILFSVAVPIKLVPFKMFDEPDDRKFRLHYNIEGAYTLDKVEEAVDIMEAYLFEHQEEFEIRSVYSYYETDYAMSTILLEKGDKAHKTIKQIQELVRKDLPRLPIVRPSFEYQDRGGRGGESVQVKLTGKSSEELVLLSKDIAWVLSQIPGLVDARSEAETGHQEVHVIVDRKRASQYGFTTAEIANVVSAALRGINLRRFHDEEGEIQTRLVFQENDRQNLDQLQNLPLFDKNNNPVKLATLADFEVRGGPRSIRRINRNTSLNVISNLNGISVNEARNRIQNVLKDYRFPPGYVWNFGERFDYEQEALNTMLFNLVMALVLIYFLMAALFESLIFPGAVWTQIIFSVVGVYWFFFITGTTMSVMGLIGILILIGVVVNNGIVLIDHVNQLRERGKSREEAILDAGRDRLRPILMTAGTTVLSLVPLCMVTTQIGGNGPPYFPMARAIVGGLTFSTLITLLILPTIYILLDDLRNWFRKIFHAARM